jgi:HK97 gp10 family phage protein
MSVTIRKSGFDFASLSRRVRGNIADVLNEGANSCVSLAKQLAPVDTGFMRNHIAQTEDATPEHLRVTMESQADYSAFVEYGTVHMEAQPFFTPAFEAARRQVNNSLLRVWK